MYELNLRAERRQERAKDHNDREGQESREKRKRDILWELGKYGRVLLEKGKVGKPS